MNALSAGVINAVMNNTKRIRNMKETAMELAQFYQGAVKIEINIDKSKTQTKFNLTEFDM